MKTYIIAEIGINHNGSLNNCLKLVDAAVDAGCDAAKFQMFSADHLYPKSAGKLHWKDKRGSYDYNIFEATKSFEMPLKWVGQLIEYCDKKCIEFICSVSDIHGLNYLVQKGMKIIKLSSYTITHIPLIEACALTGLPIILSTGGASLGETEEAVNTIFNYHKNLKLLHCSIQYPTELKNCNLGVIETMKHAFSDLEIGYSDHTFEISDACVQSIYLGSALIEKHITLNKKMDGPDHFFALEPLELKKMVMDIRYAEKKYETNTFAIDPVLYGSSIKQCHDHERYLRKFAYMTMFTTKNIKKGDIIKPENILMLRPGKKEPGLLPKYLTLFENYTIVANKDLAAEDAVGWDAII